MAVEAAELATLAAERVGAERVARELVREGARIGQRERRSGTPVVGVAVATVGGRGE